MSPKKQSSHSTEQYSTLQYSTVQYSTEQAEYAQLSTVHLQYSTGQAASAVKKGATVRQTESSHHEWGWELSDSQVSTYC